MTTVGVAEPLVVLRSEVGESPLWDHRSGQLVWVDILGGHVHLTHPRTGATATLPVGQHVGAAALHGAASYLLAVRSGFATLTDGEIGQRVDVVDDPDVRMNDGKVDRAGRFVVGTMAYDAGQGRGRLYSRDVDGATRVLLENVTVSNGIAWSNNGDALYYVDSPTQRVDVFDYCVEDGTIANRRPLIIVPHDDGAPDGITVDAEGCIWVALFSGGAVRRYSPDGETISEVTVPTRQVTSCAFGGEYLDTLFITTAAYRLDPDDQHNALAGSLFAADAGCRGRPEPVIPSPAAMGGG